MKKVIFFSVIIFTLGSCRKDKMPNPIVAPLPLYKMMDLVSFKVEVPQSWTYTNGYGTDSQVGHINISETEFATFDLGWYSNKLNVDSTAHVITYTTIDGKSAKIVEAADPENGTTGVYFASIDGGSMNMFTIYSIHLSASHQQELLTAIGTLDFVD